MDAKKEKCYLTRDEDDDKVWVWRRPHTGIWSPENIGGKEFVNYQRTDHSLKNTEAYIIDDFKNKFKISVNKKEKRKVSLPTKLLNNEDYKLISNDPKRKK